VGFGIAGAKEKSRTMKKKRSSTGEKKIINNLGGGEKASRTKVKIYVRRKKGKEGGFKNQVLEAGEGRIPLLSEGLVFPLLKKKTKISLFYLI